MSETEKSLRDAPPARGAPRPDTDFASVYTADDVAQIDLAAAVGEPGGFPFTRGIYREMYQRRLWTMRQYAGFQGYFGDQFIPEMEALIPAASLNLRTNTVMDTRERAIEMLREDNVKNEANSFSPWGIAVKGKAFLSMTRAFKKGLIEIQDEGSQMIALACDVKPGQQVLDYCAGAGGKTLALAAAMKIKGRIVAMDLEASRLAKARDRFRRAKVSDIIEPRPLSDEKNRKWLRRQKQTFDCVLVDVPCSGTGTWRRNPDMRWRTYGPSVEDLVVIQTGSGYPRARP